MELGIPACKAFIRAYKAHERAALDGVEIAQWRGKMLEKPKQIIAVQPMKFSTTGGTNG